MWVWSLGQEDPLEEGTATHSGILAWRIPWIEEPGGLQSLGLQRAGRDLGSKQHVKKKKEKRNIKKKNKKHLSQKNIGVFFCSFLLPMKCNTGASLVAQW